MMFRKELPMKSIKRTSIYLFVLLTVLLLPGIAAAQSATDFSTFTFTRTHGRTNVFSKTVTVPPSYVAPFTLTIVNGGVAFEKEGKERDRDRDRDEGSSDRHKELSIHDAVSSGSVWVDGIEVVSRRDFSKRVHEITVPLTLSPGDHQLEVRLDGEPDSYMTLRFMGVFQAPPVLAPPVLAPPVLAPPVLAPPVLAPPVLAPPVLAPPVLAPPVL